MRLVINKDELLFDIKQKSHKEVASIADAEARYKAEVGTEKMDEVEREVINAVTEANIVLARWIRQTYDKVAVNDAFLPDEITFDLAVSERRLTGKVQMLTDAVHNFLVHAALGKIYATLAQPELAKYHDVESLSASKLVEKLINTKTPPTISYE